jgi:hypothetical protein
VRLRDYIRCGTPDCDWGFRLPDLQEGSVERCYAEFRSHCIERHGLDEADNEAKMFFDLDAGTLTLFKD